MDIEKKVKDVIYNHLDCLEKDIVSEARLADDLDADSLDLIEIAIELEGEFDTSITDEEAEVWVTVGNVVKFVTQEIGD